MGAFFTNLQVRNTPTQAICAALPKLTQSRAYVSPQSNGWVTVYLEETEDQDDKKLCAIVGGLSKTLKTDVLGFMVHDSDIALYWLYRNGTLVDEFNCAPDYFGERVSDATRARVRGNTDALLPLCVDGTTHAQLDEVLHPPDGPPTFVEEIVTELAKLLGIDDTRASLGFKYFDEEAEDVLPDAADFVPVGKGTERKESEAAEAKAVNAATIPVPDMYPLAVGMLTQIWSDKHEKSLQAFSKMLGQQAEGMIKQMRYGFDKSAREFLKKSKLPGLPTIDELVTARDQGPDALAELIAKKTPDQLTEVGFGAAVNGLEAFLAALLKRGLDPNAPIPQGRTTLSAAEQHGKDSAVYRLVKTAAEGK